MLQYLRFAFVVCFALFCQNVASRQTESALITREALFCCPDKEQVTLSPDGK